MGPTASGKTALAEELADRLDAVLINADAFQVYRHMHIGTAKPVDRSRYELLDLIEPSESFGLGDWLRRAQGVLNLAFEAGRSAVVVGGTGLYVRGLMEAYAGIWPAPDPELRAELERRQATEGLAALFEDLSRRAPDVAAKTDAANPARVRRALERVLGGGAPAFVELPAFRKLKLALDLELPKLYLRIGHRFDHMVQNGWLAEVEELDRKGFGPTDPGFRALGYRELWGHLKGEMSFEEAKERAVLATRRYGKRQRTWLRTEPRLKVFSSELADTSLIWNWIHDLRGVD